MKQLLLCLAISLTVHAETDTSHHRAVYAEINQSEGSCRKVTASVKVDAETVSLTAWIDAGEVRKLIVKRGNAVHEIDEYYLENEKPLFVFSTYDKPDSDARSGTLHVEERIYFENGNIVKWLNNDKSAAVLHGEDYESQAEYLNSHCAEFVAAVKRKE